MAIDKFLIEASHIMMFARSVGDDNPVYYDEGYKSVSGCEGIIAPPTFAQSSAQFDPNYFLRPKIGGEGWFGSGKEATGAKPAKSEKGSVSGGGAAAVASGECMFALGSDTGGSIRQPAAFCGIVGLKPTYGLVSRYGLIAFASSLDQIGPLTRTVADNALVLEAIAGNDPHDATSITTNYLTNYLDSINEDLSEIQVGIPIEYWEQNIEPKFKSSLKTVI